MVRIHAGEPVHNRKMMREVPKATAMIVNPTYFVVALKYDHGSMTTPLVVVVKRKNYLALRIRKCTFENQVPLGENPPLAQALYKPEFRSSASLDR